MIDTEQVFDSLNRAADFTVTLDLRWGRRRAPSRIRRATGRLAQR